MTRPVLEEWADTGAEELAERGFAQEAFIGTGEQRAEQLRLAVRVADRFARAVLAAAVPA